MKRARASQEPRSERAALVGLTTRASARAADPDLQLDELAGLARAAGADVVLRATQERPAPDPATLIGRGKAETLARGCDETGANLVIVDHELTPGQARNLEKVCGRRVIDRTELILDIFARRARTREGQLQVELAQLQYRLPRLAGSSDALSRLGGGIGTRGPGETKLETDRRRIRTRIAALKAEIAEVGRRRGYLRSRRKRADVPSVALVGYTNAGKTTLFNRLTGAAAAASPSLFQTLDPLVRRIRMPDARQILVSDTVGFIDRLPHQLVAAFRATLEEVAAADLLLHVIDASAGDRDRRTAAVQAVLADVGAGSVPVLEVFNKIDRLTPEAIARLRAAYPGAVFISATAGAGLPDLAGAIASRLFMDAERLRLHLDERRDRDRRLVADLYRQARVVSHAATDRGVTIEADVPRRLVSRFRRAAASE
jgi:GTP-binding protein HflX